MKVPALPGVFMLGVFCFAATSTGWQQSALPPPLAGPAVHLTPSEVAIYRWAPTLNNWTPQQVRKCPLLQKLQPAASQDQLAMILKRVGETGALTFHDFSRISCDEEINSETYRGRRLTATHHKFRYVVIPRSVGDLFAFDEYRTDLNGNPVDASSLKGFMMTTTKYASTWLYLSPADQPDSHFRYFGIQSIRSRDCHVVGFAQDPERVHSVGTVRVEGQNAALLVQGMAWVDCQTFQILKIVTWLLAPREDIDLSSSESTVEFYPIRPGGADALLWLPRDVTVQTLYRGVQYRNTHRYSNFRFFRVESTIKPGR